MTDNERRAMMVLAEAWNAFLVCVEDRQARQEACASIHHLQNAILAQATIRSEPSFLRQPIVKGEQQ
jgi:hypothetical protein